MPTPVYLLEVLEVGYFFPAFFSQSTIVICFIENTHAYTSVCHETGENFSIISPLNNTEAKNKFLDAFAKTYNHYRIILCFQGAGGHKSKTLNLPENIQTVQLPAYSPELNPTEHIWDYIWKQKKFNNFTFPTLDAVEIQLEKSLRELNDGKEIMKSMCNFSWLKVYLDSGLVLEIEV